MLTLTGCTLLNSSNNKDSSTSETPSSSSSSNSQSSSSSSSEPEGGEIKTFDFKATSFTDGANIDQPANHNTFLEYLNKDEEDNDIVTDIATTNCYFRGLGKTGDVTTLQLGTGSSSGSITFTFAYNISEISFTLQGYHKWNSNLSEWSLDPNAQLDVEGHHYDLGSTDENPPAEVTDTISISPSKKSITFSNETDHQRGFIHSLTITYIA